MERGMKLAAIAAALVAVVAADGPAAARPALDLDGYQDDAGAISVQHRGDTVDPYFALQALLVARDAGFDVASPARRWIAWLLPRQKPDATFDRFCRRGPVWGPCKTADADDALHAMWMKLLESLPEDLAREQSWRKSLAASAASLERLRDPQRGVYRVSPVYRHALFIDNLEVAWRAAPESAQAKSLSAAIRSTFWEPEAHRFRVTTQPHDPGTAFYPQAVAQIFPLVTGYAPLPEGRARYYREWMREHRGRWLAHGKDDFAWGLIATVALQQGDRESAACWLREALPLRHGPHWTVTDEVARQALAKAGVRAATPDRKCT